MPKRSKTPSQRNVTTAIGEAWPTASWPKITFIPQQIAVKVKRKYARTFGEIRLYLMIMPPFKAITGVNKKLPITFSNQ